MEGHKIKCIIIDDDPTTTDLINHFCSKIDSIAYCTQCHSPVDGLKLISEQAYDLLFLDYNMPDISGEGILKIKQDNSKVIMITSNPDFALDSYNYPDVIDYLLKPLKFERFSQALNKFYQIERDNPDSTSLPTDNSFFVKDGNKWVKIDLNNCRYIKSESNYVSWQLADRKIFSLNNMKDLEAELPSNFIRIHRSFIINKEHIDFITKDDVSIADQLIPVGKKYKDIVASMVKKFT